MEALGHSVISPPDMDAAEKTTPTWDSAMRRDIKALMECDAITMLPGWERSEGARIEKEVCDRLRIKEIDEHGKLVTTRTILQEAQDLIGGDRQASYGHPRDDFKRTAGMWSSYLGHPILPEDIPLMMVLLKTSREKNRHKRDNLVDMCGYAGTTMMLYE